MATEGLIDVLSRQLRAKLDEAQIEVVAIDGRIKRLWSIHQKLQRQRIPLEQVYDFIALRVITKTVKDCYGVLGIIHQIWSPVAGRFKDFIAMPRPNGYQALHTSVVGDRGMPFEVQIRTEEMHQIAEEGIAAHWKYKEGRVGGRPRRAVFQLAASSARAPAGGARPAGVHAEPPDRAVPGGGLHLHAEGRGEVAAAWRDAGRLCVSRFTPTSVTSASGRRVNGRMVPLRTRPHQRRHRRDRHAGGAHARAATGSTSPTTSRARTRSSISSTREEKTRSVELGRRLLDKELRRFTVDRALVTDEAIGKIAGEFSAPRADDLFAGIGYGKVTARAVLTRSGRPGGDAREVGRVRARPVLTPERAAASGTDDDQKIKVRGIDDLMVFRARCCNPIRGERIVGYITRGKGVSVHSASCPNVVNLLFDPDRRIDVEWDTGQDTLPYIVRLKISVEDRRGILADVSSRIADIDTNIKDVEATVGVDHRGIDSDDGRDQRPQAPRDG